MSEDKSLLEATTGREQAVQNNKLEAGTLWQRIVAQTEYALQCGALLSIPTAYEFVEQEGVRFLVRMLANLVRKEAAKKEQDRVTATSGKEFNPFLPYETDLFVADLSETHLCLLNKYNVVDHHILIITRDFEEQESLLTLADFEAMAVCLAEMNGLAFYNGGKVAGASQRHKHLQLVPFPLLPDGECIPISSLLQFPLEDKITTLPALPFVHAFTSLDVDWVNAPTIAAQIALDRYYALLHAVGLQTDKKAPDQKQPGAYNLLTTREWMLLVPRSQESFENIPVNSLGFAGTLLVRNQEQMQFLKQLGPMNLLSQVGIRVN